MEPIATASHVSLAVRDFVAPLEREGSLNQTRTFGLSGSLRQVGAQIHSTLQAKAKETVEGYRAEMFLSQSLALPGGTLVVSGRLDGLYENSRLVVVEEIKSTSNLHGLLAELRGNPEHPYILQAKMYAWMLAVSSTFDLGERELRVRMRIVSVYDTDEERSFELDPEEHTWPAFGEWVLERAQALLVEHEVNLARQAARREEGEALLFPFDSPRPGQLELVQDVEKSISSGTRLMLQAPTGLGKTAAVLYPNLKNALIEGKQVFYLTPKNSQHRVAQEAVERLRSQGREVRSVAITAKEKSCLKEEVICDPKYCEYAAGYYDKLRSGRVLEELAGKGVVDFETLREVGMKHKVCPFELSLDFTSAADVVVCDYNYVFSPSAALQRYFEDEARSHLVNLVVDEAHNLYSRAMDLYSPRIAQSALGELREKGALQIDLLGEETKTDTSKLKKRYFRLLDKAHEALAASASRKVTGVVEGLGNASKSSVVVDPARDDFYKVEGVIGRFMTTYAEKVDLLRPTDPVYGLFKLWSEFCGVMRLGGDEFVYTWQEAAEDSALQCTCCDASRFLKARVSSLNAVTAFSATLKPFDFYAQMSGFEKGSFTTREFSSPFPHENRKLLLVPQVSTAYKDRSKNYGKVAEVVGRVLPLHKGNYFVFFPSFAFLAEVQRLLVLPGFRVIAQKPGMTQGEAFELLAKFKQKRKNVVVLAVQGGSLAEGIDLPGEDLVGAIVVGPSLPGFDLERECIRAYFDRKYGRGFDYAYVYPAMARVVQATGRVIRTPEDRGLLVLCDKRFLHKSYVDVMPSEWLESGIESLQSRAILRDVEEFWERTEPKARALRAGATAKDTGAGAREGASATGDDDHDDPLDPKRVVDADGKPVAPESRWIPKFPKPSQAREAQEEGEA